MPADEPGYYPKGITRGYTNKEFEDAYDANQPHSKNQLFACDLFALIKTFEDAAEKV